MLIYMRVYTYAYIHTRVFNSCNKCTQQLQKMYCNTLQHTATTHCSTVATNVLNSCNTLQHTTPYCSTPQHTTAHEKAKFTWPRQFNRADDTNIRCNTLQHTTAYCNTLLQHTATHEKLVAGVLQCVVVCCSVLQCVAVCCNVWQCVAVCQRSWLSRSTIYVPVLQRVAVCCS